MNRKISTLLAGAALLTAVSANANVAVEQGNNVLLELGSGSYLSVQTGNNFGVPTVQSSAPTTDLALLNQAMWNISVGDTIQGKQNFTFVNKATGRTLAVDPTVAVTSYATGTPTLTLGGSASVWTVEGTDNKLVSYFTGDSVVYIANNSGTLYLAKTDYDNLSSITNALTIENTTLPTLTGMELKADDLNTMLRSRELKDFFGLTMDPEVSEGQENLLTATGLKASDVTASMGTFTNWVYLQAEDKKIGNDDAYVVVDTAYYEGTESDKFLKFTYDKLNADKRDAESYAFRFTYNAFEDELYVQARKVVYQKVQGTTSDMDWASWLANNNNSTWTNTNSFDYNQYIYMPKLNGMNVLTVNTEETMETSDQPAATDQNVTIKLGTSFKGLTMTTIPDGVYTIQYKASEESDDYALNNAYALANLAGKFGWAEQAERQDFNHMPAAQWVVKKNGTSSTATVTIDNREFWDQSHTAVLPDVAIQFYAVEGSDDVFYFNTLGLADTLSFVKVADELVADTKLGYKYVSEDEAKVQTYTFNYLHGLSLDHYLLVGENGTVSVDPNDGVSNFRLEVVVKDDKYGYEDGLVRNVYYVKNGESYLTYNATTKKYNMGETPTPFFLKENNCIDGKHYYALVEAKFFEFYLTNEATGFVDADGTAITNDGTYHIVYTKDGGYMVSDYMPTGTEGYWYNTAGDLVSIGDISSYSNTTKYARVKVSVDDNSLDLTEGNIDDKFIYGTANEIRTSAFAVEIFDSPLYRHFNNVALGETEGTDSLIFREKTRGEYLMDEWNENLQGDLDYAGIWNEEKAEGKLAFIVDTVWVNRGLGNIKPQYLVSVARDDQGAIETIPCTYEHNHYDNAGNAVDAYHCSHATQGRSGFDYGKYLVSFADSVVNATDVDARFNQPYMDVKDGYTRVGFVKAIHIGDSLIVLTNGFEKVADPATLDTAAILANYRANNTMNFVVNLQGDQHKNVTWSFRYVTPSAEAPVATEEGEVNEFLFESNVFNGTAAEKGKAALGYTSAQASSIAPSTAAWLKMQNGCLVLTDASSTFDNAKTGGDGALIFNAYQKTEAEDMVTSNEEIAIEGVQVIAGNGQVTIQGAAGKTVVITNILGKVVANTVLTSDNATITVPAGIVAVAVEGEEAVKAIVK